MGIQGQFFRLAKLPSPPPWIVRLGRRGGMIWTLSERRTALGLLAYLGLAEGAALYALANGSGSSLLLGLSAPAIASGFFAIGVLAMVGRPSAERSSPPGSDPEPNFPAPKRRSLTALGACVRTTNGFALYRRQRCADAPIGAVAVPTLRRLSRSPCQVSLDPPQAAPVQMPVHHRTFRASAGAVPALSAGRLSWGRISEHRR